MKSALKNEHVRSVTGWTDSAALLYWLNGKGVITSSSKTGSTKFWKGMVLIGSMF